MIHDLGTRRSFAETTSGALSLTVANFAPVTVTSIELSNNSGLARIFSATDADAGVLFRASVPTLDNLTIDIPFKADNGIKIVSTGADTSATVFHKSPGI